MPPKSDIGKHASDATTKEFESELAQYTTLTPSEISALFPQPIDKEDLLALLKIVKDSTSDHERKAKVVANIDRVAGVVIKLAGKYAGIV